MDIFKKMSKVLVVNPEKREQKKPTTPQNSKPEKREQKNPSSKKTEQTFTLYKTQILPTFDFFNKP